MRVCNNPTCMSIHNVMYLTQSDTIGIAHAEVMYLIRTSGEWSIQWLRINLLSNNIISYVCQQCIILSLHAGLLDIVKQLYSTGT